MSDPLSRKKMEAFDQLPREIRDYLNYAETERQYSPIHLLRDWIMINKDTQLLLTLMRENIEHLSPSVQSQF